MFLKMNGAKGNQARMNVQCAETTLSPHQMVVFEIAKLMAAVPTENLGEHRGLLAYHNAGSGKCHGLHTKIMMADGHIKEVQDIVVGEKLMGDDSTPRTVLSLARGQDAMYRIIPTEEHAESWECNRHHILVLEYTLHKHIAMAKNKVWCAYYHNGYGIFRSTYFKTADDAREFLHAIPDENRIVEMELQPYLQLERSVRNALMMYRTAIEFDDPQPPAVDPYDVGTWLGDHIPHALKTASKEVRLQILAGLVDGEYGSLVDGTRYEIVQPIETLANDIAFVARSLGFAATTHDTSTTGGYTTSISGAGLERIPSTTFRPHTCAHTPHQKNPLQYGFRVEPLGTGEYYGFEIDGNRRYVLGEFTVTHNTVSSLAIIMAFWPSDKRIVIVSTKSNTSQAMASYRREAPRFFPDQYKAIVTEYKQRKKAVHLSDTEAFNAALDERVKGLTFVEARNRIAAKAGEFKTVKAIPLHAGSGSVMVIDEAQGLAVKSRTDPQGDAIKLGCALRKLPKDKMRKIRVFAMTATPGNSIKQWLKLLSVVRRADQAPFTLDNDSGTNGKGRQLCDQKHTPGAQDDAASIQKLLRGVTGQPPEAVMRYVKENLFGLVAYVDIRSDTTRHACIREIVKDIPMDRYYFVSLLKFNAADRLKADRGPSEVAQHRFDPRMPDVFMKRMRILGHSLPKTVWSTLPKEVQEELTRRRRILKVNAHSEGRLVSPKFVMLADYLARKPGKQYCYTVSGNEFFLGTALEKWYKVVDVTRKAETFNGAHYNKAANKVVGIAKGNNMIILNDTTSKEHRDRLVGIFNSPANLQGEYIRIVIASGQLYEGLDLAGLRHVNLADPLPTPLQEMQAIGRGARNCSHRGLPLADRNVTIVRWFSTPSKGGWGGLERIVQNMKGLRGKITPQTMKEEFDRLHGGSYDQLVFKRARDDPDFLVLHNWERIMQSMAIDCGVLSRYHPNISCGTPKLVSQISLSAGSPCAS